MNMSKLNEDCLGTICFYKSGYGLVTAKTLYKVESHYIDDFGEEWFEFLNDKHSTMFVKRKVGEESELFTITNV